MPPRSTRSAAALWVVLLQLACAQHHGDFAVLGSRSVYDYIADTYTVFHARSSGRACFSLIKAIFLLPDSALRRATEEALEPFSDANALLLVEIDDQGFCIVVSGVPARIDQMPQR